MIFPRLFFFCWYHINRISSSILSLNCFLQIYKFLIYLWKYIPLWCDFYWGDPKECPLYQSRNQRQTKEMISSGITVSLWVYWHRLQTSLCDSGSCISQQLTTDRNCASRVPTQFSGASNVHLSVSSSQQVFYCSHDFPSPKFHELPESWKFRGSFVSHGAFLLSLKVNASVLSSNS